MLDHIVDNFLLIYSLEFGAALAGTYYISKNPYFKEEVKWFVYYLWLVVLVELVGLYPSYAYFEDYKTFFFIKDTPFERNFW